MFIFGGDRHHMPFNDLFILDLLTELEERELIDDQQEDEPYSGSAFS